LAVKHKKIVTGRVTTLGLSRKIFLSCSKNTVIATIPGVADPVQLVYNPSNHVAGHNSNSVSIIDTTTNKLIGAINGFPDPTGVGYNSATGNIYVGNQHQHICIYFNSFVSIVIVIVIFYRCFESYCDIGFVIYNQCSFPKPLLVFYDVIPGDMSPIFS
jgi:YVTN family beta-propeller protein